MQNSLIDPGMAQEESDRMTIDPITTPTRVRYVATWTDNYGTTYQQNMELAPGDVTADLEHHEQWVRENHDVSTYTVTPQEENDHMNTTVIAKHDDHGTLVSIYKDEMLSDRYYVYAEEGNWRDGIGKVDHLREYWR